MLFNASNDTSEFMEPEIDLKRVKRAEHTTKLKEKLSTMITNDHQNAIFFFFFCNLIVESSVWALEKMVNLNCIGVQGDKGIDSLVGGKRGRPHKVFSLGKEEL